jgi:hypothetical protein
MEEVNIAAHPRGNNTLKPVAELLRKLWVG